MVSGQLYLYGGLNELIEREKLRCKIVVAVIVVVLVEFVVLVGNGGGGGDRIG